MTPPEDISSAHGIGRTWEDHISPLAIISVLLRHRYTIVLWAGALALISASSARLSRQYTAESRFTPQTADGKPSQLAGVAAQFGFNIGSVTGGESIDFYTQLLKSRELLSQVATMDLRIARQSGSPDTLAGTYLDINAINGATPEKRLLNGVRVLEEQMVVSRDLRAGIVTLQTTARWPGLAEAINRELLRRLDTFNQTKRRSTAASEREFIASRLKDAQRALDSAEDNLATFLERNRSYQASPQLTFEKERRQRQVEARQRVYSTLADAYEKARIEEVRNTPLIVIIDKPEGSAKSSTSMLRSGVIGWVLGLALGIAVAFLREYRDRERAASSDAYNTFRALVRSSLGDIRPARIFGRTIREERPSNEY